MDTAILSTNCEHNVAEAVAGELSPVIRFLSHTVSVSHGSTAISGKKIPCIFTGLVSLLPEYPSYVLLSCVGRSFTTVQSPDPCEPFCIHKAVFTELCSAEPCGSAK
jgi:hypothetical protein